MDLLENVHWLGHASFRITGPVTVYIDPWNVEGRHDADLVLVTHDHYDHCSPDDVRRVAKTDAVVVCPPSAAGALRATGLSVRPLSPGGSATVKGVAIEAVAAYNSGKRFHPRSSGWNGYVLALEGGRVYHAGDTDLTPEVERVRAEIALLPVGGTYTMDADEAARAAKAIGAGAAVPMHWGAIVGGQSDAQRFCALVGAAGRIKAKERA